MTQEEDKQLIFDYREKVRQQYTKAQQTGSEDDIKEANKMYGALMYRGNQYTEKYGEPIDVLL